MPLWHDRPNAWHEVLPGVQRRILAHEAAGMMVLYRIAPGRHFPRHTHPNAQFGVLLEGGGRFVVGDQRWELAPGDSYWVPAEVEHELTTDANRSTVILDVFTPQREEFLSEALPPDAP